MHILSSSLIIFVLAALDVRASPSSKRGLNSLFRARTLGGSSGVSFQAFKRQADVCGTQCSSSSDANTIQAMGQCASNALESNSDPSVCICQQMARLSSGCSSCILNYDEITPAQWAETCAAASSLASGATAITSAAGPASTSSAATCASDCTSSSDASGVNTLASCSNTDYTCLCGAAKGLSQACLTCVLTEANVAAAQFEQLCSASSTTATLPVGSSSVVATLPAATSTESKAASATGSADPAKATGSASASGSASSPSASAARSGAVGNICSPKGLFAAGAFVLVGGLMTVL